MFSAAAVASLVMVPATGASGTTPSRLWWGVERIVVACDGDAGAQDLERAVCSALIANVRSRVSLPVVNHADSKGGLLASDLMIKVAAEQSRASGLKLTVRPKRVEIMNEAPAALVTTVHGDVAKPGALDSLVARSLEKILPSG